MGSLRDVSLMGWARFFDPLPFGELFERRTFRGCRVTTTALVASRGTFASQQIAPVFAAIDHVITGIRELQTKLASRTLPWALK
jgi:hypothetical protein